MKRNSVIQFSLFVIFAWLDIYCYDLTIIGPHNFNDGISRRSIGQIKMLKDSLKINYINTRPKNSSDKDIENAVLKIIKNPDTTPGTISFFVDILIGNIGKTPLYNHTPNSKIKFAFVTFESTKAHPAWVNALNNLFDGAIVPDPWLIDVLKQSGVKIPIFVLPEICFLEDFLKEPLQEMPHNPFVFGISALFNTNKNYALLLEAFAAEFKNSHDVILKIHSKFHKNKLHSKLWTKIKNLGLKNVVVNKKSNLHWNEYVKNHMSAIDCYVLLSLGEGFSITPREALALGRPCILANHTAHKTICDTGLVRAVEPTIIQKHSGEHYGVSLGNNFNCTVNDARKALRDVYENYDVFLHKAHQGREWVKQYLSHNLKAKYLSLFKPKKVILGSKNEVSDDYLIVDSEALYQKYLSCFDLSSS